MEEKLADPSVSEEASKYARLSVMDIYMPIIKSVASNYSVDVQFK